MDPSVQSGLVQFVTPSQENQLTQNDSTGGETAKGADDQEALKDTDSPIALPAIPTTEAPYDGKVCFGTFKTDVALDGDAT